MAKRFYFSIVVFIAWCLFATLFYKTLCVMLLCWVWRKDIDARMPEHMRRWGMKAVWGCQVAVLWIGMPRYRVHSGDRVRLVYLDDNGKAKPRKG